MYTSQRFTGAVYLGGYAVECALVSLICFCELKDQFEETSLGNKLLGSQIHQLDNLLSRDIAMKFKNDSSKSLWTAFRTVASTWKYNELRYGTALCDQELARSFLGAVKRVHAFFLREQDDDRANV